MPRKTALAKMSNQWRGKEEPNTPNVEILKTETNISPEKEKTKRVEPTERLARKDRKPKGKRHQE